MRAEPRPALETTYCRLFAAGRSVQPVLFFAFVQFVVVRSQRRTV
jgi:hypothetical protein